MTRRSVQSIEDFYMNLGHKGEKLRKALESDKELKKILALKKATLSKTVKATKSEKKKYVLATDEDFDILKKCKRLQKKRLSPVDKTIVRLILTQLKPEWRKDLIKELDTLIRKYK